MKVKFVLAYTSDTVSEPILWKLVKQFDIKINVLRASISPGQEGNLLVELDHPVEARIREAIEWLENSGVNCAPVSRRLFWKEEACVACGACVGVCMSGALSMDRGDFTLAVNREVCTACGLCVTSCPFGCFKLDFGE